MNATAFLQRNFCGANVAGFHESHDSVMIQPIVETPEIATILGPCHAKAEDIDETLRHAPFLVAADGGAEQAIKHGHVPDAVVGDFDSIPETIVASLPQERQFRIADQDTTDFEKCLLGVSAPLRLAIGFSGQRMDHELAVMNALVRYRSSACILIGPQDIAFAAPDRLSLDLEPGCRVSLFPLACVRATSTGLKWPVDDVRFDPAGPIGTSNEVTGPLRLEFDRPGMLVILPRVALPLAMDALRHAPTSARAG